MYRAPCSKDVASACDTSTVGMPACKTLASSTSAAKGKIGLGNRLLRIECGDGGGREGGREGERGG